MKKLNFEIAFLCIKAPYSIQIKSDQTERLLNKPYVNEVTLTGQNPPLKYCQPLELLTQLEKDIDLSMLKIWGL